MSELCKTPSKSSATMEAVEATGQPNDDRALAQLGYAAELPRNMSMLSILGLSFAIMSVPLGISTTWYISLTDGQSVTALYGWILVSLVSLCTAASMAEICAVYPTAGGVYYWSAILSTRSWAPLVSWIDGWLGLVGNWTAALSINFSGAQVILSAITLWNEDYVPNPWQTVLTFWALTFVCVLLNLAGTKVLDKLNQICVYWTVASVIIIMITLLTMADEKRTAEFVFAHYDASAAGWPNGWAFFVGLLQGAYTLIGYGMVASMCEEVPNPERTVPRGLVLSVLAAGITGLVYMIPILFVLPDVKTLLSVANGQPIGLIFKTVTGSASGGFGLLFLLLGILLFAGTGAITAASRFTFAFARDKAIPGHHIWSRVNKRLDVPLWALILTAIVNALLSCIYFGSSAAFNSFTGVCTICLSTSYGLPVLVSVIRGRRDMGNSPFSLGKFGLLINLICITWIGFSIIIFCMPVALPVTASTMNYASVVFAGFASISVAWYVAYGRKHFHGPPVLTAGM
ncbi:amino acid permease family protein [Metarhizium robertsii]|uniref:Amino acid permease n=2 Tax=Metarhizium robertsii TaxID=568076 RepID=E9FC16_METRA|nr:amino acid permease [Metarhizium robertsii ARSEF 23]EFY94691.1 amino acid permease [Metarhizium robertsii ARSEF 23]EXU96346.1 amino acid permease family protein [Metarhizium robertsii]